VVVRGIIQGQQGETEQVAKAGLSRNKSTMKTASTTASKSSWGSLLFAYKCWQKPRQEFIDSVAMNNGKSSPYSMGMRGKSGHDGRTHLVNGG
jgi:hypothetical protein